VPGPVAGCDGGRGAGVTEAGVLGAVGGASRHPLVSITSAAVPDVAANTYLIICIFI
jgi:hypothetical protein